MDSSISEDEQAYIKCDLCGQSYGNQDELSDHMSRNHSGETTIETIASIVVNTEEGCERSSDNDIMDNSKPGNIFPCLECGKIYKSKNGMTRHVKIHHSFGNGFNCKICSQTFATKLQLKTHVVESHPDDPNVIKCSVCDKIFADKATLSQHFKSHRVDRPFECRICNKSYKEKRDLLHHEESHSTIREYSCDQCTKSFLRERDLKRHLETHSDLKPFKCDFCDKTFRTNAHLRVHRKHHTNPNEFECFICEKKFAMKHSLKRHLVTHRQKKQFSCSQCNKAYHFKHRLDQHVKAVHNNERPHECQVCKKTFTTKENLKIHFRIHSGEHPYQCSMCPRTFSQLSNKHRHELIHKAIKEFKCLVCKKEFYTQYECKTHMLIHQTPDSKPFKCTECNKGFVKAFSLREHVQRNHLGVRHTCTICNKAFKTPAIFRQHVKKHECEKANKEQTEIENGQTEKHQNAEMSKQQGCNQEHNGLSETQGAITQEKNSGPESVISNNSQSSVKYDLTVRPYCCDQCTQSFRREQDMKRHVDYAHNPFKCQCCKKTFRAESELVSHSQTCTVPPGTTFVCSICGKNFSLKANLKRHMEIHSRTETKECPQCQKEFRNEKLLKRHQVIHSDTRAFVCNTCNKGFRRAEDLIKHNRTHTGESPYKCRFCDKAFKQCNNRQRHEQTHTSEKRFKCETCNRSFSTGTEVREHMLTHQVPDGKYFKCDLCNRAFSHSKSLKCHVDAVHMNPRHGCSLCNEKFSTAREAKRHEKIHLARSFGHQGTVSEVRQEGEVLGSVRESVAKQNDGVSGVQIERGVCEEIRVEAGNEDNRIHAQLESEVLGQSRNAAVHVRKETGTNECDEDGNHNNCDDSGVGNERREIGKRQDSVGGQVENRRETRGGEKSTRGRPKKSKQVRDRTRENVSVNKRNDGMEKDEEMRVITGEIEENNEHGNNSEARDNNNTTEIRVSGANNSKAASNSGSVRNSIDTTRKNDASNEAIRKILEGKPFICPVCDKGYASRSGLKHHYDKTHQNTKEKTAKQSTRRLYYCYECNEGFKTKRRFWLHDVKVHGLIENSSENSDSVEEEENNCRAVGDIASESGFVVREEEIASEGTRSVARRDSEVDRVIH